LPGVAVDSLLQMQATADVDYFLRCCGLRSVSARPVRALVLKAYRWQYIVSGVQDPRYMAILGGMITAEQGARIETALAPILNQQVLS
jgi:hypothetical protein